MVKGLETEHRILREPSMQRAQVKFDGDVFQSGKVRRPRGAEMSKTKRGTKASRDHAKQVIDPCCPHRQGYLQELTIVGYGDHIQQRRNFRKGDIPISAHQSKVKRELQEV